MAKCPYFGKCGGCSSQHIDYKTQLENKKNMLAHTINFKDIHLVHDEPFHYRNRMDFIFHPKGIGLRAKGKWYHTVDVEQCIISNEKLNKLITEVRTHFKGVDTFDLKKNMGTFRFAVIRTPGDDSSISFVLNEDSTKLQEATDKIKEFAKTTSANNIIVTRVSPKTDASISEDYFVVKGEENLKETLHNKEFHFHAQGFFQNNTNMANKLQDYVQTLIKKHNTKDMHLLDLYGGVGTFGIINSDFFKSTTIVEDYKGSIEIANENIKINNSNNTRAIVMDAKQLRKVDLQQPLFVITDPPRSGMHHKTIQRLNYLEPEVIIYISCNPKQLGKELLKFPDYKIKSAAMFDLFPQTPHAEAVVELVRTGHPQQ
ncbi:MAG: 23S rRNA (uracil(1939)-C(5))-methyltransferase RlmD [Candidatus Nanoarchaeia archaeon]